jgi:hypothetical protein
MRRLERRRSRNSRGNYSQAPMKPKPKPGCRVRNYGNWACCEGWRRRIPMVSTEPKIWTVS